MGEEGHLTRPPTITTKAPSPAAGSYSEPRLCSEPCSILSGPFLPGVLYSALALF
jgi:hypothetical protein